MAALEAFLPIAASGVGTALISAGAALLGALVGGAVTYAVENRRATNEKVLERERRAHEGQVRGEADNAAARAVARVLIAEFVSGTVHGHLEQKATSWMPVRPAHRMRPEDWKELFRHLSHADFLTVLTANAALTESAFKREAALATDSPYSTEDQAWAEEAIAKGNDAIAVLKVFSGEGGGTPAGQ